MRAKRPKSTSSMPQISIRGARVHNLKDVDVDIPKHKLVVITGLSGSGKSSLAFDTIYAEAERRFVESLSAYARQFLGVKSKPDVESIDGLSPAISIDQKSVPRNPRSTVGTITEIYDYLRILFARLGIPHCPSCGEPVGRQSVEHIVARIERLARGKEMILFAPLVRGRKGEHKNVLEEVKRAGFLRARIDGEVLTLDEALAREIDKKKQHTIEVVVDRFVLDDDIERSRIRDSVETALKIGKGLLVVHAAKTAKVAPSDISFSEHFACADCGVNLSNVEPRLFSFNSPYGACVTCTGLGSTLEVDPALVIPNPRLSIAEGAIRPWSSASHRVGRQSWYWWILSDLAETHGFSLNTPVKDLPKRAVDLILFGESDARAEQAGQGSEKAFEGVIPNLKRRWKETDSDFTRAEIEKYMLVQVCATCDGARLQPDALSVRIGEENIASIVDRTVDEAVVLFSGSAAKNSGLQFSASEQKIALPLIKEISKRLLFLQNVGVGYLTLARESTTLAGGEARRIQLATQIGSRLTGVLYVLDEPSIGLHPRDHSQLISTLEELRDIGNTVVVVEHDTETIQRADWVVDLGPGAGRHGGKIVFSGTPKKLLSSSCLTGQYLSGKKKIAVHASGKEKKIQRVIGGKAGHALTIKGATEHNLKNIHVSIPLGKFVCVSGVSGSGKSTLINDILARALRAKLNRAHVIPGAHKDIRGIEHLDKAIVVDQSPIGRTPRSNPVTYTGAFSAIRSAFAGTVEARARGYAPGRFSFNVKGGRCETCEGQGVKKIEMYFLPDVFVECEECRGKRYNREALEVEYNGKTIADVLDMSVEDALKFFHSIPAVATKLRTLTQVGLGYVKLGQPAPTLSGGEAQRIKLATELSRRDTGRTLYILDEPTTGLHFDDVQKLLSVLTALVKKGNSVLVIEHNIDVLKNSDWIIDLGPGGGDKGGDVVAQGTPEEVQKNKLSATGQWLKKTS